MSRARTFHAPPVTFPPPRPRHFPLTPFALPIGAAATTHSTQVSRPLEAAGLCLSFCPPARIFQPAFGMKSRCQLFCSYSLPPDLSHRLRHGALSQPPTSKPLAHAFYNIITQFPRLSIAHLIKSPRIYSCACFPFFC